MKKHIGRKGVAPTKGVAIRRAAINVGDIVQFKFGASDVKGHVVEDRGHIGFKGRNLYRILVSMEGDEPMNIELPEEEIRIFRRAPVAKKTVRHGHTKARKLRVDQQKKQELGKA